MRALLRGLSCGGVVGSLGYKASIVDPELFIRQCRDVVGILHTKVDDCAGTGPREGVLKDYDILLEHCKGPRLGTIHGQAFLGM
jgi:hypothetical protein